MLQEGITGFELGKPAEIAVHRPEFSDSPQQATCCNPRVMDQRTPHVCRRAKFSQCVQNPRRIAQDAQTGRFPPRGNLLESLRWSRRLCPDFRMRDNTVKFHKTVQANRPGNRRFREFPDGRLRIHVQGGFPLVGMHQQVGVSGDHGSKEGSLASLIARLIASFVTF